MLVKYNHVHEDVAYLNVREHMMKVMVGSLHTLK